MIVQVTYNNDFGGTPHAAAEVNAPTNNINEALEYAFRWTQNISGSWSKKIGDDANDNVKVLYHNFLETPLSLSFHHSFEHQLIDLQSQE